MIRELAGHDPTRYRDVMRVRVRDGLSDYVARLRERALEQFRHEQALFVAGGLKKAPKWPSHLGEP